MKRKYCVRLETDFDVSLKRGYSYGKDGSGSGETGTWNGDGDDDHGWGQGNGCGNGDGVGNEYWHGDGWSNGAGSFIIVEEPDNEE